MLYHAKLGVLLELGCGIGASQVRPSMWDVLTNTDHRSHGLVASYRLQQ